MMQEIVRNLTSRNQLPRIIRNAIHWKSPWLKNYEIQRKNLATVNTGLVCQELKTRGLVRVSGEHAGMFLQGLITNDMCCLETKFHTRGLYACMLNVQGRVTHDLLLYKPSPEETTVLVECDADLLPDFIKTLRKYKIRKKVDIKDVSDEQKVWAAFPRQPQATAVDLNITDQSQVTVSCPDPRLSILGHRLILPGGVTGGSVVEGAVECSPDEDAYKSHRYQLGVGEGPVDLPQGSCFPLEANLVFLNGVSFTKGCYVGQELTARTHHTGVIRKRLMPFSITSSSSEVETGDSIINSKNKSCGKVRGVYSNHGLALLRIGDALGNSPWTVARESENKDDPPTSIGQVEVKVPDWWPTETDEVLKSALKKNA